MAWLYLSRKFIFTASKQNRCKGRAQFLQFPRIEVRMRSRLTVLLVALISLGIAATSSAQYFGRNKVQYERFDFKVLNTEHFDIYYYPEEEEAVKWPPAWPSAGMRAWRSFFNMSCGGGSR